MLALISDTGFGSCLLIITLIVGVPLAWRAEAKKKPAVAPAGRDKN